MTRHAKTAAVLYAKDLGRLRTFYAEVTGLEVTHAESEHVVLESPLLQLVIVAIPESLAKGIDIGAPPIRRTDNPIKLAFFVSCLSAARDLAPRFGGQLNAVEREWIFQGDRVCDGHDPEGNVVQFREDATKSAKGLHDMAECNMERAELARAICAASELHGHFVLRSGETSDHYFDKYQFECRPLLLMQVARAMAQMLSGEVEVLAGLELGGIPLAVALGQVVGRDTAFVRKKAKDYGTCRVAEGTALKGRNVLLIEDIVTSGGALCDATLALREEGVVVSRALCVVERKGRGRAALAALGVQLDSLFTEEQLHAARNAVQSAIE